MLLGDFTDQAKHYVNRPGYSLTVLQVLKNHIEAQNGSIQAVADVGAGTGKLTENLADLGLSGFAVEPNDAMREEGIKALGGRGFVWSAGTAETTGLPDNCVDWVLMGTAFHWVDAPAALQEFYRILRPGGFFSPIWNLKNFMSDPLHMEIEKIKLRMGPDLKRFNSDFPAKMDNMGKIFRSSPYFGELFMTEASHSVTMSKESYIGLWRSESAVQVLAEDGKFDEFLKTVEDKISHLDKVVVPYLTRAFTVRSLKK